VAAFAVAFGVVLVAELGDRTQLLILTRAGRLPVGRLLAGLAVVIAGLQALSVTAGTAIGDLLPDRTALVVTGVLFLAFAAWTWSEWGTGDPGAVGPGSARRGLLALLGGYAVAELGDKSMLATAALAASNGAVETWAGATLGLFLATVVGVVAGRALERLVAPRVLRSVGAGVLLAVGVAALVAAAMD
jgi:putative Ca2+/H+ antiporter (TMEM165/GDT1 family)